MNRRAELLANRVEEGAAGLAAFAEGLSLFPKDAFLNYGAAINLGWGLGRHTDALPLFQAAVAAAPKDAAMRAALAWCLLCVGKIAAGVDLAGRTLRSHPPGVRRDRPDQDMFGDTRPPSRSDRCPQRHRWSSSPRHGRSGPSSGVAPFVVSTR